ncbi:MAG TPA: hypothetical protein VFN23_05445, partial [Ktedonobacteraceae bacterium]|nr:hypothetical protein [Ktedonobacteraceae bacterium]
MNTSAPAEHPIADPMLHLSAKPKRKSQNPLLKLSITRRLALGFLFPMLAIFAGLGSIGFQSNQLLEDNTNFNQHLLNASTSLTAGINTLEEIHTNILGIINDASRTQTTQETLLEDQGSIKNLSAEYDSTIHTYL